MWVDKPVSLVFNTNNFDFVYPLTSSVKPARASVVLFSAGKASQRTHRRRRTVKLCNVSNLRYPCPAERENEDKATALTIWSKIRKFSKRDKWYETFQRKILESPEIVEFPKSEPFNRKFRKFQDESQMEREFPGIILGITHEVVLFFEINANLQFPTQRWLVLLATITVSWSSHARMTATRIR